MARRISSGARTARLVGRAQSPHRHTFRICARRAHPRTRQGADRPAARRAARAVDGGRARLQRETQTLPIVFVHVSDPIGAGIVSSLARPEANLTGVLHYEAGIVGKWLAMLKEMSPRLARVCRACQQQDHGFRLFPMLRARRGVFARDRSDPQLESAADIERALEEFARLPDSACFCRLMPRPFCIRISSSGLRRGTGCSRFIRCRSLSRPVA